MSEKIDKIIEELKSLTLLEASQLVKQIEETFGVDASSGGGMMMVGAMPGAGEAAVEEKTSFTDWFRKFHNIQYFRTFCHFWRFFLENFPYKRRFAYAAVRYFGAFLKKCIVFMYDFCLLLLALHMYSTGVLYTPTVQCIYSVYSTF